MDDEIIILENQGQISAYVSKTGHICIKEMGFEEESIVCIPPDAVHKTINTLMLLAAL